MGDVTILVNNAAVVHGKSLMDSDDDALLKSQHINTMGQFWVRSEELFGTQLKRNSSPTDYLYDFQMWCLAAYVLEELDSV